MKSFFSVLHTESLEMSQDCAQKYEIFVGHLAYSVTEVNCCDTV